MELRVLGKSPAWQDAGVSKTARAEDWVWNQRDARRPRDGDVVDARAESRERQTEGGCTGEQFSARGSEAGNDHCSCAEPDRRHVV